MLSFNGRMKSEIARRDAARFRLKQNAGNLADAATGAVRDVKGSVNDLKSEFAPSKIVNGIKRGVNDLKDEYDPKKVIVKNPLGIVAGALAAGFVVVPVLRTIVSGRPAPLPTSTTSTSRTLTFPNSGPHHLVIEVKGGSPAVPSKPQFSIGELILEAFAALGGMQGIMAHFAPQPSSRPVNTPAPAQSDPQEPVSPATPVSPAPHASISRRYAPPPSEI